MTYLELILLIQERQEKVLTDETYSLVTDKRHYIRQIDVPENEWKEDPEPGAPEKHFGRSGEFYIWKRSEEL